MFTLFFIIIFIAELIIAYHLIMLIRKCDATVCALNKSLSVSGKQIHKSLIDVRLAVNKGLLALNGTIIKLQETKERYKWIFIKNVATTLLLLALNTDAKKVVASVDLIISIKDFFEKTLKRAV